MAESKAAAGSVSKQAELAKSIADIVEDRIRTIMTTIEKERAEKDAELACNINVILTRLEAFDQILQGQKRPVKTERKTGGGPKKGGSKKAASGDDERDRVKNSMLYFRWAFANDAVLRDEFTNDDSQAILDTEDFSKKSGDDLLKAQAALLWKKYLTDDQKKEMKQRYQDWDKDRQSADSEPQLEGEDGAAENGAGDDGSPDSAAPADDEVAPPPKPAAKVAAKASAKAGAKAAVKAPAAKAAAPKAGAKAAPKKA